jgi:methylphosphotriester-DNA--protein-cysteine methyltransferase
MWKHAELNQSLSNLIRKKQIKFAGNAKLKIYGRLSCYSGKRMKKENRVFFENEMEAISFGFRPCKNCMKKHTGVKGV